MPLSFILLVILGVITLWFFLSFLYKPIGKFILKIYKDAIDNINETDKEEKENEKNEKR